MKRRKFLKYSSLLGGGNIIINGLPLSTFASYNMVSNFACDISDRVLVVIQLKGGNDGINNLVPWDQYDTYSNLRPNIRLAQNDLLQLDTTLPTEAQIGLNPALQGFKGLYEEGKLHIVQGVSYPQNNKSHFKSTDLWLTAGDGTAPNFNIPTGWIGRYLDNRFPNFSGLPTAALPDPLGIQLGDKKPSLGFHTEGEHRLDINLSGQDPGGFYSLVQSIGGTAPAMIPNSEYGAEIQYILNIENSVSAYAQRISNVFNAGMNSAVTYPSGSIADQLKTVARLVAGGSKTKIFVLQHGGFDTHVNQVIANATTTGKHTDILQTLADALKAFQEDITELGLAQRVLSVTFSEFGRKAEENGNNGTDHGTLIPMYIIGDQVNAGVSGINIDLSNLDNTGAPHINQLQHDYRQVFGTLLQDWLGASEDGLTAAMMKAYTVQKLPLIKTSSVVEPSCYIGNEVAEIASKASFCVFLEGFYDADKKLLKNDLAVKNLIPTNQPFKETPWLYEGEESMESIGTNVVDWVLVAVRDRNNPATILAQQAALVSITGHLLNMEQEIELVFKDLPSGEYYVSIHHKSHLAILSSQVVTFIAMDNEIDSVPLYSFANAEEKAMGDKQLKRLHPEVSHFGMYAGDFDQNNIINSTDFNLWKQKGATVDEYLAMDGDGNGIINSLDYNLWVSNRSKVGNVPVELTVSQ